MGSLHRITLAATLALLAASPAGANHPRTDKYIACAGYHHFFAIVLKTLDPKQYKSEIDSHEDETKSYMELAQTYSDSPRLSASQVKQAAIAETQRHVAELQQGRSLQQIHTDFHDLCEPAVN